MDDILAWLLAHPVKPVEWTAFGMSMVTAWYYGHNKLLGAIAGITTAMLFVLWGYAADVLAASLSNGVFLTIHIRNLRRAINERRKSANNPWAPVGPSEQRYPELSRFLRSRGECTPARAPVGGERTVSSQHSGKPNG
jgi:hypothetical protein